MKVKKTNIQIAIFLCIISLLIFTSTLFPSTDQLLLIGNNIENIVNIHTNINVETMRTFITTIFSGVFASSLVALCLYIREYQCEKEILLRRMIDKNREVIKLYLNLPFLEYGNDDEYSKTVRGYYLEYYDNLTKKKFNDDLIGITKKIPKSSRREFKNAYDKFCLKESNKYKNVILKYFKQYPDLLKTRNGKVILTADEKLKDIILVIDNKVIKALEIYKTIREYDLHELEYLRSNMVTFKFYGLRKRKIIKKIICDKEIVPNFHINILKEIVLCFTSKKSLSVKVQKLKELILDSECSNRSIVERIFKLHKRAQNAIKEHFLYSNLDYEYCTKADILYAIYGLQEKFLGVSNIYILENKIDCSYKKFVYCMENLNNILLYEWFKILEYSPPNAYAMTVETYERGQKIFSRNFEGKDLFMDLYRPH